MSGEHLKRFLLFGSRISDVRGGGWNDFIESFEDAAKAQKAAAVDKLRWWHVVDTSTSNVRSRFVAKRDDLW